MKIKALSVSEINKYIKRLLISDPILSNIYVKGEISNLKLHSSGHMYFTLKDEDSKIACIMFKANCDKLTTIPQNGSKVMVKGYISLYERDGLYQLYVNEMESSGLGDLYIAYEKLKAKLEKEGLFKSENKKTIPFIPDKVAIITSPTGAAIRDIISVVKRRFPKTSLYVFPVAVQGQLAAPSIVRALELCNTFNDIEVIILGRGGGSIEELWAFNEEAVARAIYNSDIPVISAVGHETDYTIADFVADIRAHTPSAAAELAVPKFVDVVETLETINRRLIYTMNIKIHEEKKKLDAIKNNYHFKYPLNYIYDEKQQIDELNKNLVKTIRQKIHDHKVVLNNKIERLNSLNPLSVFSRGYAIARDTEGNTIKSIEQVKMNDVISISMLDGEVTARVENLIKEDKSFGKNGLRESY
ncbi:Exodeoxyribonuclease VII large subunit [Natronincola peptidivorans]|uniref:Exodeoxyribonuclease 7 large subunit n=1 Tax=Natronincola peptidivorans TaxID=426128 RepID=A0A1H9YP26_9FIRM|nr:exodeoxyribonuclease VII large subunit [Natronincola peptidivorans]SES70831.1 Exodeoxyribonuclease VII large subunit [Natronincola peptidivorans]